jgi:rhamnosyltransferase
MKKLNKAPQTSIIIRTKNEAVFIKRELESVFSQQYRDFEVIIIDSGSKDRTLDIAKTFPVTIQSIRPEEFSYGHALNVGARFSRGEYVVCLSAHALPANPNWLGNIVHPLATPRVAGVYGKQRPYPGCNLFSEELTLKAFGDQPKIQTKEPIFSNANSAINKRILSAHPFNETVDCSEDCLWAKEVQQKGYCIAYAPSACVYHSHNDSIKRIMRSSYLNTKTLISCGVYSAQELRRPLLSNACRLFRGDVKRLLRRETGIFGIFHLQFCRFAAYYGHIKAVWHLKIKC